MGKILLVEDDNNLREIYEARLQAEGYTILAAKDGEEALVLAKSEKPDLVISDVMMPKISGFEMLDILRNTEELKDVKVIMLTALGQSDDQQRANRLGADHYLVKSQVTLEDIVKVAHDLLQDGSPQAQTPPPVTPDPATPSAAEPPTAITPPVTNPPTPVASSPTPPVSAIAAAAPMPAAPAIASPAPTPAPSPTAAAAPIIPPAAPAAGPPVPPAASTLPANEPSPTVAAVAGTPGITDSAVQSAAQEAASVEDHIEDFVSGATTAAPEPNHEAPPEAVTAAEAPAANQSASVVDATARPAPALPPVTVGLPATTTEAVAADDKVIADAVNNLIANTASKEASVTAGPTPAAPASSPMSSSPPIISAANATMPLPAPVPEPVDSTASALPANSNKVTIANKKVIAPIDSSPKKDLNALLALEQAKEASNAPAAPPAAIVNGQPVPPPVPGAAALATAASVTTTATTTVPTPAATGPAANNPLDPNSIAL